MIFKGSDYQNYLLRVIDHGNRTNQEEADYYSIPLLLKTNKVIDLEQLRKALNKLTEKHEILRTMLKRKEDGQIYQEILKQDEIEIQILNMPYLPISEDEVIAYLKEVNRKTFVYGINESYVRCNYLKTDGDKTYLLLSLHGCICDDISLSILKRDLVQFYLQYNSGNEVTFEEPYLQFADFSEWQEELAPEIIDSDLIYWKRKLKNGIKPLPLPTSYKNTENTFSEGEYNTVINEKLREIVNKFSIEHQYKKCDIYLTALKLLFMRYTNQEEICFETRISERMDQDLSDTVGPISNTALLIDKFSPEVTFLEALRSVTDTYKEAKEHSLIPFYRMLAEVGVKDYLNKKEQSQIIYVYQRNDEIDQFSEITEEQLNLGWGKYDYNFLISESDQKTNLFITYNKNKYSVELVEELVKRWTFMLEQLITVPELPFHESDLLNIEETAHFLKIFNQSEVKYSREMTITDLLSAQVAKFPDKTAIVCKTERLTYQELDDLSDQLALQLISHGIKNGNFIAIFTEKKIETIVGICAIVKAGGVYVPVDPGYPQERINYLLNDCSPKLILGCNLDIETNIKMIKIDEILQGQKNIKEEILSSTGQRKVKLSRQVTPQDLIYLLYTSGTTGEPKGVMIEQKSVIRLVHHSNFIDLDQDTIILQTGSLCFDAATLEIWGALLNGGELHLTDNEVFMDSRLLKKTIEESQINTMWLTVTLYNQLVNVDVTLFDNLKYLLIGGEKVSEYHIQKLLDHNNRITLINGYGPTETTTFATTFKINRNCTSEHTPIGKPISNTEVYILSGTKLCAPGMVGELCIAGDGVGRGYLNSPELTAQKFVDNPFKEGKMYRSGDLARWLPDGNIEYLGRTDEQIKIRGFRIELGEIENIVKIQKEIKDAVAIVKEKNGEKYICLYLISDQKIDINEYHNYLRKYLPDFMMPDYLMQIDQIPITANGKLNKKALPEITFLNYEYYVEPKTTAEKTAVTAFEDVLGLNQIGINSNFFQIGGHSLMATKLINLLEEKTGIYITLKELYQTPTPAGIANKLEAKDKMVQQIQKADKKEVYEMTSAQKRIYAICSYDNTGTAYNINMGMEIEEKITADEMIKIYKILVSRHESLRTSFIPYGEQIMQKISEDFTVNTEVEVIDQVSETKKRDLLASFIRPFNLAEAPLFRMKLIKVKDGRDILFFDMHHIISDGMSLNLILDDYIRIRKGENLSPVDVQYKDYSEWLNKRDLSNQKDFWLNEFQGEFPSLDLFNNYKRPLLQSFWGSSETAVIPSDTKKAVETFCIDNGITEYMVLLSAFFILLHQYSNQEDMIVGSPVSGRVYKQTEAIIGMFVNTVAMRGAPVGSKPVMKFLQEIKEKCLKAQENQEYPLEDLVRELDIKRDGSRNPLFDVVFNFQNIVNNPSDGNMTKIKLLKAKRNISKFDLTATVTNNGDEYDIEFEFCTDLFNKDMIKQMMNHFQHILKAVVTTPETSIAELECISAAEKDLILNEFSKSQILEPEKVSMALLFEEQVKLNPEKVAVVFEKISISYHELNQKANIFALELKALGVGTNNFVAIMAERRIETVIAMLAVVKAGGAYVPIDPSYPKERIDYILQDCEATVLLYYDCLEDNKIPALNLSDLLSVSGTQTNPTEASGVTDLVYLIYTSGTTGKPKGTMVEQRSVIGLVKHADYVNLDVSTVILQTGSLSFDAATFEIWGSLLNGGKLCIVKDDVILNAGKLKKSISHNQVNTMFLTTALFNQLLNSDLTVFDNLENMLTGGESASEVHIRKLIDHNKRIKLSNIYGPTETTTFATWYPVKPELSTDKIPIGRPIAQAQIYILKKQSLCGIGMAGELCIAGNGVARGYLNKKELTAAKFTNNPYGDGLLYHSGDLARWMPDGNIEFLGRIDEQIKLRGFRIELGEIEAVFLKQPHVIDVVVIVREKNGESNIFAYVVSDIELDLKALKAGLQKELPNYMVPPYIIQIDRIPLTRNGKLSKHQLPDIALKSEQSYEAPKNQKEQHILHMFEEILGIEQMGMKDNFYELGGDSIKAIRVISKLREAGYDLSIRDIMQMRIMEQIISRVQLISAATAYDQGEITGAADLTPIQHSFFRWNMEEPSYFNQSVMLETQDRFDQKILIDTVTALLGHHDILRAVFQQEQIIFRSSNEDGLFTFETFDCIQLERENIEIFIQQKCSQLQAELNIFSGPLVKTALFTAPDRDYLMICIHHLVIDGISWRILIEDFINGYQKYRAGDKIVFPDKTASYLLWSEALKEFGKSELLQNEIGYWSKVNEEVNQYHLNLLPENDKSQPGYGTVVFELDEAVTQDLLYQAGKAYHTEINDILLAALGTAIKMWTGQKKIALHLEGHGREEIHKVIDITRTVGWFTSIFPIVLEGSDHKEETIIKTKEMLRHIPNRGMGYGVIKSNLDYGWTESKTEICFNYLGQWTEETPKGTTIGISKMQCGNDIAVSNKLNNPISITGEVGNGRLLISILYDRKEFKKEIIDQFAECYKSTLIDLIEFCVARKDSIKTASDYGSDLTEDVMSELLDLF